MGTRVRTEPWSLSSLPCALGPTPSACEGLCWCWAPGGAWLAVTGVRPLCSTVRWHWGSLPSSQLPVLPGAHLGLRWDRRVLVAPELCWTQRSLQVPAIASEKAAVARWPGLLGSGHPPGPRAERPWEAGVTHGARPGRSLAQDPCWGLRSGGDSQAALS